MELEELRGLKLVGIRKDESSIEIEFRTSNSHKTHRLKFRGYLFETPTPALNKKIRRVSLRNVLGFNATTLLRRNSIDPNEYRQLLIEMEGSNENFKIELMCVFRNYELS